MVEEEDFQRALSLFQDFPALDENSFTCLTPWPSGKEMCGGFDTDLFGAASPDPVMPSPSSGDPFLRDVADIRSTLAHIAILRFHGICDPSEPTAFRAFCNSMGKFSHVYPQYAATIIQRFWRANRQGATARDKVKFGLAMIVRPRNGSSDEERSIRKNLITELLEACPPEFSFE